MIPSASIIVATYNGALKLPYLLEALSAQSYRNFEVIVVVDGSTDSTLHVLEHAQDQFIMQVIYQQNMGRSAARNHGASMANSDLLVFFDDDMVPDTRCVEMHIQAHKTYPNTVQVGRAINYLDAIPTDYQIYKAEKSLLWEQDLPKLIPLELHNAYLPAGHFSVSKKLFEKFGGFDPRLFDAEDYDLALRIIQKKYSILFNPYLEAMHRHAMGCVDDVKRSVQYAKAQCKLLHIHPEYKDLHKYKLQKKVPFIKLIAYTVFSLSIWPRWVDKNCFLCILPKKLRYCVYDLIVYSPYAKIFLNKNNTL